MERQVIGKIFAITFNNEVFSFIVYDDNTMDCPKLNITGIKKLTIKPRFELSGDGFYYIYDAPVSKIVNPDLIGYYQIDKDLFPYLKDNNMIKYSIDMAYLYNFNDKDGYDKGKYCVKSPYKHAKFKGPILAKQKRGKFN